MAIQECLTWKYLMPSKCEISAQPIEHNNFKQSEWTIFAIYDNTIRRKVKYFVPSNDRHELKCNIGNFSTFIPNLT